MTERNTVTVPADSLKVRRRPTATIALVGNPNSGKSTVFNRLTGMRQHTANYPGATVEKKTGVVVVGETTLELIDLPGTYALSPYSADERIAVDVLLGQVPGMAAPDAVMAVVDATRLYQGLYLVQQLVELGKPMIVALTMTDISLRDGVAIATDTLSRRLGGVPVIPVVATTGRGFDALRAQMAAVGDAAAPEAEAFWPQLRQIARDLQGRLVVATSAPGLAEIERALIDTDPARSEALGGAGADDALAGARSVLFDGQPPLAVEARQRYRWIAATLAEVQSVTPHTTRWGVRLMSWLSEPWPATLVFIAAMAMVFQAVFAWATPMMDLIDAGMGALGDVIHGTLPPGVLASFLADGVIAGVGSVVIFLPQILILFLFVILMEDTGYLARAAFLVDRAMRSVGLSGHSVIPLLSSFACAVPAIMATRVIPNRRDRIATILAAPFMTCSARLPVYALLIAAFVPRQDVGVLNLQGLVLFGLYLLGIVAGAVTALLLKASALKGRAPTFMLALPEFRRPNLRTVLVKLFDRARVFLRRAGTVIFAVAVVVWALAYFPRSGALDSEKLALRAAASAQFSGAELADRYGEIDNLIAADHLAQSWLGRAGRTVEPVFAPLGWDWKVSAAVIAGFPAREVVVAVLGTIYAVGNEADEASLAQRLQVATWPDGRPVFTLPMVLGLLAFYALCLQCVATLAVMRRETNTWRWPVIAWTYMTGLGYLSALLIFQLGSG